MKGLLALTSSSHAQVDSTRTTQRSISTQQTGMLAAPLRVRAQGGSPSQGWKTFFRNHAHAIVAIDLFVVPTLTFERLFAFLVVGHGRRQWLWFEVTRHPTAEWLARQITEGSLAKDAPVSRPVQRNGRIVSNALVGGLHRQYVRI